MTYEALLNKIQSNSKFTIASQKDLPSGKQIKFNNGAIVNWFNTERITYQGKNLDEVKTYIENDAKTPIGNKVFVVYGHDDIAKTQLEAMLRRWELNPIILDQIASEGKTIIEKLEDNSKPMHKVKPFCNCKTASLFSFIKHIGINVRGKEGLTINWHNFLKIIFQIIPLLFILVFQKFSIM